MLSAPGRVVPPLPLGQLPSAFIKRGSLGGLDRMIQGCGDTCVTRYPGGSWSWATIFGVWLGEGRSRASPRGGVGGHILQPGSPTHPWAQFGALEVVI